VYNAGMKKLALTLILSISTFSLFSEVHTVQMLNAGKEGMMVFEPAVITIKKGDTVKFIATDMSHNSSSVDGMIPEGAEPWIGGMSQDVEVTLSKEGVYVYQCTPHNMMAMVGVIKVESSSNIDVIKLKAESYKKTFLMNQERLDNYLSQL
jgi:pseudoazurin